MELVVAWGTVVGVILTAGWLLDQGMDAEPDRKLRFGQLLREKVESDPGTWLRAINRAFVTIFKRLYGGRGGLLEEALWAALLLSPVALILLRIMVMGSPYINTNDLLLYAMAVAGTGSLTCLSSLKLAELASRSFGTTRHLSASIFRGIIIGTDGGIVGGIIVSSLGGIIEGSLGGIIVGSLSGIIVGSLGGIIGGSHVGIISGIVGGIIGGIVGGIVVSGISIVLGAILNGILLGVLGGILLGGIWGWRIRVRFQVHPLKALASSLFFICIIGAIQRDASSSFVEDIQREGLEGFKLLAFVAFNLFADGVSLLETLWLLRLGRNARVLTLVGLLALDVLLSAMIFLFLPIVLWEIPAFLEAALFRGDRPWLGILFWSTFSTSVLFYLFVLAALLVRPLAALAKLFGWLSRPFNLEAHPVWCLSIAMALVVTVGFIAGGVVQALAGSSGVTPPP